MAKTYVGMTDGELLRLAKDPQSLTEIACDALENELDRRRLECPEGDESSQQQKIEVQEFLTIRKFRDLPEALLAKGCLESAGIECFLGDENLVRLDWFISNFIGGIKLKVKPEDAENARKILDEPILEGLYVHGVGLYEQPRCPKCDSLDVNFREVGPFLYLTGDSTVSDPAKRSTWRCQSCSAEWEEENSADH